MSVALNILDVATKPTLQGFNKEQLKALIVGHNEPPFRAAQLFTAIYARRVDSFDAITDLPKALREKLNAEYRISPVRIVNVFTSTDETRRYLFDIDGGHQIESVWIPEEHRDTICISSQAG